MNNLDQIYVSDAAEFSGAYLNYLAEVLRKIDPAEIAAFAGLLLEARETGAMIFFIGNGGSAATASHFANDIGIGTKATGKPFRALSLVDNVSMMTAIANDFGYEEIFVRQLQILAKPGDVLVGISASGNSENLTRAFDYAAQNEIRTLAITGFDGGRMKEMADLGVHVPTLPGEYGPAEDAHMVLDHLIGAWLMRVIKQS